MSTITNARKLGWFKLTKKRFLLVIYAAKTMKLNLKDFKFQLVRNNMNEVELVKYLLVEHYHVLRSCHNSKGNEESQLISTEQRPNSKLYLLNTLDQKKNYDFMAARKKSFYDQGQMFDVPLCMSPNGQSLRNLKSHRCAEQNLTMIRHLIGVETKKWFELSMEM
jgi:hypothetical protein